MPADLAEIQEGDEEGIVRRNGWGPVEILTNGSGRVRGVVFRQCLQVYDADRRFAPRFDDAVRELIECDSVILSVGQVADLGFLDEGAAVDRHPNGSVVCDPTTGATSVPGIFVAGDLAYGAKLLIHAVASGKRVARSVYEALTGLPIRFEDTALHFNLPGYGREAGYEARGRTATRSRPVAERLASLSATVELGFDEAQARLEASRCLDCGVNTLFDGEKCIACGGCVDVCPQSCLYLVPLSSLDGLDARLAPPGGESPAGEAMAIIKDETVCIRCGLCATRCPATAITMERFRFSTKPVAR
jgi:ferredoxin